ncbi:MAG: endonuclease/exonuclease/phosphatase family protein [Proteobacteria bacterium]|nr:endonuclease/exonuclease/phosphatase family protein [Pseudomonadota bacterium]
MKQLDAFGFDPVARDWKPISQLGERWSSPATSSSTAGQDAIVVATYNVWFNPHERERRWRALVDEVQRNDPDVIAFQEVTRPFLALLRDLPWVQREYSISDPDGRTIERYGIVLLSRRPLDGLTLHDMPSHMGRKLLVAHFAGSLAVATIHLESLRPSAPIRDLQFARCVEILDAFDHAMLMGDMNFCSSWAEENARIPDSYTDVWPYLHPDDPGYTEDTSINHMLSLYEQRTKRVRYDRIFLRSQGEVWQPLSIKRLGTRPIGDDLLLFPSDHFGLTARFARDDVPFAA